MVDGFLHLKKVYQMCAFVVQLTDKIKKTKSSHVTLNSLAELKLDSIMFFLAKIIFRLN